MAPTDPSVDDLSPFGTTTIEGNVGSAPISPSAIVLQAAGTAASAIPLSGPTTETEQPLLYNSHNSNLELPNPAADEDAGYVNLLAIEREGDEAVIPPEAPTKTQVRSLAENTRVPISFPLTTFMPHLQRLELEGFRKFSESHLWKLMSSFYDRQGVNSWSQGIVPNFITSNTFIAKSYAKVLQGYLRDCLLNSPTKISLADPIYVIELGAGAGKFSFLMIKALHEMKTTSVFPIDRIVYVMTDFTEENMKFWLTHPALKQYVDSGSVEFGKFDAVNDNEILLRRSGVILKPSSVKNPICVVANYLFDTLYHDLFQVDTEGLKEGLVSVGSSNETEPDILDPEIIKRLENLYEYRATPTDYYDEREEGDALHLNRILKWYADTFTKTQGGASILVPIGALRAIRHLMAFSGGRGLLISGDKGHNNPDQFRGLSDPHIAVHGSFSVMVNYHAIGMYFTSKGGFALQNPQEEASLKVSAFVMTGDNSCEAPTDIQLPPDDQWLGDSIDLRDQARARSFPFLAEAFEEHICNFGPNDFFVMQKTMKEDAPAPTLKAVIALLKLGDWDPDVFYKFRNTILDQAPTSGIKLRNDICRGMVRLWQNHYALDNDKDIAFEIGRFYYSIRDYKNALSFYEVSSQSIGEHHITYHNMGLCYYSTGHYEQAISSFDHALRMKSDYEKSKTWRHRSQMEMARQRAAEHQKPQEADANGMIADISSLSPTTVVSLSTTTEGGTPSADPVVSQNIENLKPDQVRK